MRGVPFRGMAHSPENVREPSILSFDSSTHAVPPEVAVSFLKETMPFKELNIHVLQELAKHCRIDFFPKGSRILTYNQSEITHLHLIQRGGVKAFITDEDGEVVLKDYRGVGTNIGALGIIRGTLANLNIETVEDTFCFLIPREIFLNLVRDNSVVAHFFLKSFSDNIVATAYTELRSQKLTRRKSDDLYLFNVTAGDLTKALFSISASTSIQEAASTMVQRSIGSLLIYADEEPGAIIGIITDTDLRTKVIAEGRDYRQPVSAVMSGPLKTVPASTLCFDVLLKMMATGIHHLGVEQGGRTIGVVTSHDIMVQQGNSPYYLFKEIVSQSDFEGLYSLCPKISGIVRNIINEGAKAGNITRMIALLNDQILSRILTLVHDRIGPPPVKYCWLQIGSEGRREQTFKTDQDNAIIYEDPGSAQDSRAVGDYFKKLGETVIGHLVKCGYPLCPGGSMASNPQWCRSISGWRSLIDKWIDDIKPEDVAAASIFFDFRHGYGTEQLAVDLKDYIFRNLDKKSRLLHYLGRQCIGNRPPISFYRDVVVEMNGEHRKILDIKTRGLMPFVDFARVLSLRYGIKETNTLDRLKMLMVDEKISKDLYHSAVDAYELQMQLRVIHQLGQIENNREPSNLIDPSRLSDIEKQMLKDAFTVIDRMQNMLDKLYPEA